MTALGLDLERLMRPRSVAVVGATDRPGSYAAETLINLERVGFRGPVWGVNPARRTALGRECVPSVAQLPEPVDAVVVAVPAAAVPEAVEQAGAIGCGGAVVFGAGFGEAPGAVGRAHHEALLAAAGRYGLPVCGPNCNGIVSVAAGVALWGDALSAPTPGPVALVSQSGNVAVNALATRRGLRFHTVVASGNQAVLTAADYLEFLAREDGVGSVALYLEDDGGVRLVDGLAACADAGVPVVVLKVGRSAAGARAAAAHSGALAGDQRVFRALVAEAGAVWADDVHELLELAKALGVARTAGSRAGRGAGGGVEAGADGGAEAGTDGGVEAGPDGGVEVGTGGVAIMTCSGGDSAQGADEAARLGLPLPALGEATRARLAELLPSAATIANPLDYTAMIWGDVDALGGLVRVLGSDPAVDQVLVFYDQPHGMTGAPADSWRAVREGVALGASLSPAPTLVCSTLPELLDDASACAFHDAGVPTAAGLRTGLRCAAALLGRGGGAGRARGGRLREVARAARTNVAAGPWLPEHAAKALLREVGVAVPAGRPAGDADDAVRAWRELGGPVAVKVSSASVQHKSDIGGVALGLDEEGAVRDAFERMAALGGAVLVERMGAPGVELLVAAHRDGVVPALVAGLGGIWAELLDDVAVIPLPASAERVAAALAELRGAPLLLGGRGRPRVDVAAVCELAARVGELLLERGLSVVECNPVLAGPEGAVAVDACVREGAVTVHASVGAAVVDEGMREGGHA